MTMIAWILVLLVFTLTLPLKLTASTTSAAAELLSCYNSATNDYETAGCVSFGYCCSDDIENNNISHSYMMCSNSANNISSISNLLWNMILYNTTHKSIMNSHSSSSSSFLIAMTSASGGQGEDTVQVGIFSDYERQDQDQQDAVWECIGCLCDTVILCVFINSNNKSSGDGEQRLRHSIKQFFSGVERRRRCNSTSTNLQLILKVIDHNTDHDDKRDNKMTQQLIQCILQEEYQKQYSSSFQLDLHLPTTPTPFQNCNDSATSNNTTTRNDSSTIISTATAMRPRMQQQQQQLVPFNLFPNLANQVYLYLQQQQPRHHSLLSFVRRIKFHSTTTNSIHIIAARRPSLVLPSTKNKKISSINLSLMANKISSINTTSTTNSNYTRMKGKQNTNNSILMLHQEIIKQTTNMIYQLEQKLEKQQLSDNDNNIISPILEFGRDMDDILTCAMNCCLPTISNDEETLLSVVMNQFIDTNERLQQLFIQQMNILREYYGYQYQQSIEEVLNNNDNENNNEKQIIKEEAIRITTRFNIAATHSIPKLCQPGGILFYDTHTNNKRNIYYNIHLETSYGLMQDMTQITTTMFPFDDDEDDEDEEVMSATTGTEKKQRNKTKKWYNKILNKLIAIGINYIQGVLALQGIRRAAAERDTNMPKFPLF